MFIRKTGFIFVLHAAVTISCIAQAQGQSTGSKFQFKIGEVSSYKLILDQEIITHQGKLPHLIRTFYVNFEPTAVKPDGSATLRFSVPRITVEMPDQNMGVLDFSKKSVQEQYAGNAFFKLFIDFQTVEGRLRVGADGELRTYRISTYPSSINDDRGREIMGRMLEDVASHTFLRFQEPASNKSSQMLVYMPLKLFYSNWAAKTFYIQSNFAKASKQSGATARFELATFKPWTVGMANDSFGKGVDVNTQVKSFNGTINFSMDSVRFESYDVNYHSIFEINLGGKQVELHDMKSHISLQPVR